MECNWGRYQIHTHEYISTDVYLHPPNLHLANEYGLWLWGKQQDINFTKSLKWTHIRHYANLSSDSMIYFCFLYLYLYFVYGVEKCFLQNWCRGKRTNLMESVFPYHVGLYIRAVYTSGFGSKGLFLLSHLTSPNENFSVLLSENYCCELFRR